MKSTIAKFTSILFVLILFLISCSEDSGNPSQDTTDDEQQMDMTDDSADSDDDTDSDDDNTTFQVTNQGASSYVFNGNGFSDAEDPELTLARGETYVFEVDASGHPFIIKTVQSTGTDNTYDEGVTGNQTAVGTVTFVVPSDAPDTLFYICEFHSSMEGTINIVD